MSEREKSYLLRVLRSLQMSCFVWTTVQKSAFQYKTQTNSQYSLLREAETKQYSPHLPEKAKWKHLIVTNTAFHILHPQSWFTCRKCWFSPLGCLNGIDSAASCPHSLSQAWKPQTAKESVRRAVLLQRLQWLRSHCCYADYFLSWMINHWLRKSWTGSIKTIWKPKVMSGNGIN